MSDNKAQTKRRAATMAVRIKYTVQGFDPQKEEARADAWWRGVVRSRLVRDTLKNLIAVVELAEQRAQHDAEEFCLPQAEPQANAEQKAAAKRPARRGQ
jgi:hypothetical protein